MSGTCGGSFGGKVSWLRGSQSWGLELGVGRFGCGVGEMSGKVCGGLVVGLKDVKLLMALVVGCEVGGGDGWTAC